MIWILSLIIAILAHSGPVQGQERNDQQKNKKGGSVFSIRRIYLPESDLQKVIQGRFLPLELSKLNELLEQASQAGDTPELRQTQWHLEWDATAGLRGFSIFEFEKELAGRQYLFDSEFKYSNLRCLDNQFALPSTGTTLDNRKSLTSGAGTQFQCDVTLPESSRIVNRVIRLPSATQQRLTIKIPHGYRILSDAPVDPIRTARQMAGENFKLYEISSNGNAINISIVEESDSPSLITVRDKLQWHKDYMQWTADVLVPRILLAKNGYSVWANNEFECQSVTLRGQEIDFISIGNRNDKTGIRLNVPGVGDEALSLKFDFRKRLSADSSIDFTPLVFAESLEQRSELELIESAEWNIQSLTLNGYVVAAARESNSIRLVESQQGGAVQIQATRRIKPIETEILELDFQNGELWVRQLVNNLQPQTILEAEGAWEIQSVIDVLQDELPVPFMARKNGTGQLLILENESSTAWIVASKKIDSVNKYRISEFIPVNIGVEKTNVQFKSGFLGRFAGGVEATSGVPSPSSKNGTELFPLSKMDSMRFQLATDIKQFETTFESLVDVDLGSNTDRVDYRVTWDAGENRQVIIELNAVSLDQVVFHGSQGGVYKRLNGGEKGRLGLSASRQYWMFEIGAGFESGQAEVSFSLSGTGADNSLQVELPQSIGSSSSHGQLRVRKGPVPFRVASDSLSEFTSAGENSFRVFQFGKQRSVLLNREPAINIEQPVIIQVLQCRTSYLDRQRFLHEIELVYQTLGTGPAGDVPPEINVALNDAVIRKVTLRKGKAFYSGSGSSGADDSSSWTVGLPESRNLSHAVLEIAAVRESGWNLAPLSLPAIQLNGEEISQSFTVEAGNRHRLVDLKNILAWDSAESLKNLTWLLSFSLDSETSRQMAGTQGTRESVVLKRGVSDSAVFLLPEKVITLLSITLLAAFGMISLTLKRNRQVLYASLLFISLVFLFGGIYGLAAAMGFWGFSIGLIIRELRRLCRFSGFGSSGGPVGNSSVVRTSLIVFLLLGFSGSASAQNKLSTTDKENEGKGTDEISVPALIPLDKDEKPTGIVYLPAKVYEQLAKTKRSTGPLVCRNTSLEILSQTDATGFAGQLRFELELDRPKRLVLPLVITGAIFDSEAVTIDSEPATFRPAGSGNAIEIDIPKAGRLIMEVRFQVPLTSKTSFEMRVPFGAAVSVSNRSGVSYSIQKKSNNAGSKVHEIKTNENGLVDASGRIVLTPGKRGQNALDVIETLDLTSSPVKRSFVISTNSSLSEPVRFTIGKNAVLKTQVPGLSSDNKSFVFSGEGKRQLKVELEEEIDLRPGALEIALLRSTSHKINKRLLLVRSGDAEIDAVAKELTADELESKWGSVGASIDIDKFRYSFEPNGERFNCWLNPQSQEISCLAQHHYYLSKQEIRLKSEFDLSSETAVPVFFVKIANNLENIRFRLGESSLDWIRMGSDQIVVFSKLDQPGRYLVEMTASYKSDFKDLWLVEPVVEAGSYRSQCFVHTNRERLLVGKLPEKLAGNSAGFRNDSNSTSGEKGYILAGTLDGGIHRIPSKINSGFDKIEGREEVNFLPGKTSHRFVVQLPKFEVGQWLGIELPKSASLNDEQKKQIEEVEQAVVERSNVLASTQIWVPLTERNKKNIVIEYDQPLVGNRVEFAKPINARSISRKILVPDRIGTSELRWSFEDGLVSEEKEGGTEWTDDRLDSSASYVLAASDTESLQVHFAESAIDDSAQVLSSRFYLSPGDRREFSFRLPENQVVQSIRVCGCEREWVMNRGREIHVPLLNNRFFQIVDIVVYVAGQSSYQVTEITIPAIQDVGKYPVFFQNHSKLTVAGLPEAELGTLKQMRRDFVGLAINNYELNLDKGESWHGVLNSWIESVRARDPLSEELKNRLANLQAGNRFENHRYAKSGLNPCSLNSIVFELEARSVQLRQPVTRSLGPIQIRILGSILALGIIAVLTARLPYWFRAPIFSFAMITLIWVFGVTWIALTPESIFAWCWMLFAVLFVCLVVIDAVLKLRGYNAIRDSRIIEEGGDSMSTTQLNAGRTSV